MVALKAEIRKTKVREAKSTAHRTVPQENLKKIIEESWSLFSHRSCQRLQEKMGNVNRIIM